MKPTTNRNLTHRKEIEKLLISGNIQYEVIQQDKPILIIADIVVSPAYPKKGIGSKITNMLIEYAMKKLPSGGRASIQLISEKGKEAFYEKLGFKLIPDDFCGPGMRKVIRKQK